MSQLLKNIKMSVGYTLIASANNTDQKTAVLDTSEFDGVIFATTITADTSGGVATLDVHGDTASSGATSALITGATATKTSTGSTLAGGMLVVDVHKPLKRYVLGRIQSATQVITFGPTIAIQYHAHNKPTIQDVATVLASASVVGS